MSGSTGRNTGRDFKDFDTSLEESGHFPLRADGVDVLQINLGRLCNQACAHCHIEATPDSSETMDAETIDACIAALAGSDIPTIDLTGGAPELNPHFKHLVEESVKLGRHVMVRCNLTVFFEPGNEDLPRFYVDRGVEVIASMPCYTQENVDAQRGGGVFGEVHQGAQAAERCRLRQARRRARSEPCLQPGRRVSPWESVRT